MFSSRTKKNIYPTTCTIQSYVATYFDLLVLRTFLYDTSHISYQSVCTSSMISSILHRSLLYAGFCCCCWPEEKSPLVSPAALWVFDGELGALGDGPFRKFNFWKLTSSSFLSSPCRSPELNLLRKKFIPLSKPDRKLENEILAALTKELKSKLNESSLSATMTMSAPSRHCHLHPVCIQHVTL